MIFDLSERLFKALFVSQPSWRKQSLPQGGVWRGWVRRESCGRRRFSDEQLAAGSCLGFGQGEEEVQGQCLEASK